MEMRIGGKEVSSPDDAWIEVKNPATGELIDRVPAGSAGDVAEAVEAAGAAFENWKKKGMRERGMILFHAAEKVREQHKDLARLLTMEQGKPLREAIDEVRGMPISLSTMPGYPHSQQGKRSGWVRRAMPLSCANRSGSAARSSPGTCPSSSWAGKSGRHCLREIPWS